MPGASRAEGNPVIRPERLKRSKAIVSQGGETMKVKSLKTRVLGFSRAALLGGLATAALAGAPGIAAAKDSVTVSVVLALAAGEWSTEILAGANAAAKDL